MAFDGFVISNLVYELNNTILNAKISKIAQPETDEPLFTLKGSNDQYRLAMSASASLPFLYLTDANKPSPLTAPNFCMLLRKHIANGRIVEISQPHMERIINFKIEHLDEMGDLCQKTLIVELMGKRSNIIFCDANGRIIDEFAARGPAGTHLLHSRDAGRPSESVGGHGGDVFGQRHDKAASDREGALHLFYRRQPRRRQRDLPPRFHRRRHVRGFAYPGCQKASLSQLCLADGGCKRAPL